MTPARPSPRFFLATPADDPDPRLEPDEARHARRVLRLREGDELLGLDGAGALLPLRVRRTSARELEVEAAGPAEREPEPGAPGAPLPFVELAVAWPRASRADAMVDRLVQLGVAALTPLDARASGPKPPPDGKSGGLARLERIARSALKQSRRTWLPDLRPATDVAARAAALDGSPTAMLDPGAERHLGHWVATADRDRQAGTRTRPIVLAVGPEGGFTDDERAAWHEAGATSVVLHPHVLRIETAAEAALAVLTAAHHARSRSET